MSKSNITLVIPGLHWNQDWLQQKLITYLDTHWIDQFYLKGSKNKNPLRYSQLLSDYVLDHSLLDKVLQRSELDIKYAVIVSPVFQNMRLHQMSVLCGNEILQINYTEANVLCEQLNVLYQAEKYLFHVITPDLWVLQTPQPLKFSSPCPYDFMDLVDEQVQAIGQDSNKIKLLQSEIQMFLHTNEINKQRKRNSKFEINGVWFWNSLSSHIKYPNNDLILNGSDIAWLRPQSVVSQEQLIMQIEKSVEMERSVVIFLDLLRTPNRMSDFQEYIQRFSWLGKYVVAPLMKMQHNNVVKNIQLVSCGSTGGVLCLKKHQWLPFFKKLQYQGSWIN